MGDFHRPEWLDVPSMAVSRSGVQALLIVFQISGIATG
jgi:hypothetical protein